MQNKRLFLGWYKDQIKENQSRIRDKLKHACEKNFHGGKPLFDSLKDTKLREIRFRAYPGGAIRILFAPLSKLKQAILLGFIKKSDSEGYSENIPQAEALLESF